jgi:hypothetical protein
MGHEYNEKMFLVHTPSILHGTPMGVGTHPLLGDVSALYSAVGEEL